MGRTIRQRRLAGQHEIKGRTKAVNIGAVIDPGAVQTLFGSHEVDRAKNFHTLLDRQIIAAFVRESGQAQIEDLDGSLFIDQQISRFDVPVNQSGIGNVLQSSKA